VKNEIVSVTIMFLKRKLRSVVIVDLSDSILESIESVVHWFRGLQEEGERTWSVAKWR